MHTDHPLIKKLLELNLPKNDYALFGSTIMFFHNLKDLTDLDVIARGEAWEKACKIKQPEIPVSRKGLVARPFDNGIEIFSDWFPGEWDINNLIDNANVVEGVKVVGFREVLRWKKLMGRPKDVGHTNIIQEYLENHLGDYNDL